MHFLTMSVRPFPLYKLYEVVVLLLRVFVLDGFYDFL